MPLLPTLTAKTVDKVYICVMIVVLILVLTDFLWAIYHYSPLCAFASGFKLYYVRRAYVLGRARDREDLL